jgi:hypothetical protein
MKRKMTLIISVLVLAVAGIWGVGYASDTCFSTYTSGSGSTLMVICISDHGNLVRLESPATFEQIDQTSLGNHRDGYAICPGSPPNPSNGGYDAGGVEGGFGPPTISQPNGANTFPLTIIRDTTSGIYRLTQKFSQNTSEKEVAITMTLKRLSAADCNPNCASVPMRLSRYFPGDVDNESSGNGYFARTKDSVWEWVENAPIDRPEGHGLLLENRSFGVDHATTVFTEGSFDFSGCAIFFGQLSTPTNPAVNDGKGLVGRVVFGGILSSVGSSMSRTVVYRRF